MLQVKLSKEVEQFKNGELMQNSYFINKLFLSMLLLTPVLSIHSAVNHEADIKNAPLKTPTDSPVDGNLQAAAIASQNWVELLDKERYHDTWDQASNIMKMTITKDEWNKAMSKTRKPLGSVKTREVVDQRTAVNPKNLPAGDYMVMVYKTSFAHKASAYELVTLYLQNGQWKVLTYQVD